MTAAVYVLTCPRPAEDLEPGNTSELAAWPYVFDTCAAIAREDLDTPHVLFVDGKRPARAVEGFHVVEWERPHMALRGNKLPYWALLEHALDSGFEEIVVFEDDLKFTANAVRRAVTYPMPRDLALVQFFAPHILTVAHMQPGLWRPPTTSFQFCQAVKFKRETLRALVDWSDELEFRKYVESDQAMNLALHRLGLRYGVHCPELVQHVGASSATVPGSTVGETSGRVGNCFPDEDFDALRLFDLDIRYR